MVCHMICWMMYQMISNSYRCLIFYVSIVTGRQGLPWRSTVSTKILPRTSKNGSIRFASTLTLLASASAKNQTYCWSFSKSAAEQQFELRNHEKNLIPNKTNPTQVPLVAQWCHQIMRPILSFQLQHDNVPQNFSYLLKGIQYRSPTIQISSENDEKRREVVSASALAWTQAQQNSPHFCLASTLPSGTRRCWICKNMLAIYIYIYVTITWSL